MEEAGVMRKPIVIPPEEGRAYEMGRMRAVFKADLEESAHRYSVSEWWLEPGTRGPGVHQHEEDHVFYVIDGTLSVWVSDHSSGDRWLDLAKGGYVVIPGETPHSFENREAHFRNSALRRRDPRLKPRATSPALSKRLSAHSVIGRAVGEERLAGGFVQEDLVRAEELVDVVTFFKRDEEDLARSVAPLCE